MAEITNELNDIMNAQYGKDVRQSIYDAIDAINTQANGITNEAAAIAARDLVSASVVETKTFLGIS